MATELFKLAIDAATTTITDTNPEVENYFYKLRENERDEGIITIPSTLFVDNAGDQVTENLTTITTNNGYYLLFVNGVLQQSDLYTVSVDGSQVVISDASTVPVDSPIILVVNNFAPTSTSTTTVTT